jgi:hypothetical protein
MSSVTLNTGNLNCWSQSGSTKKYESNLGPSISITGCSGLATSASGSIVKNYWISNSNCNYYGQITINYSVPSGYSETSSSSGATVATISATYTLNYGVQSPGTVSKTIYYKKNDPIRIDAILTWSVSENSGIFYFEYNLSLEGDTYYTNNFWSFVSSISTKGLEITYYTNETGSSWTVEDSLFVSAGTLTSKNTYKGWSETHNEVDHVLETYIYGTSQSSSVTNLIYQTDDVIIYFTETL